MAHNLSLEISPNAQPKTLNSKHFYKHKNKQLSMVDHTAQTTSPFHNPQLLIKTDINPSIINIIIIGILLFQRNGKINQ